MRRSLLRGVLVFSLAAGAASCGDDDPTGPSNPANPIAITETFTGTLTVNGAVTFPFTATQAGSANAAMKALTPISTVRTVAGGTGNFVAGETVFQGNSLAESTSTAVVHGWDPANRLLSLASLGGTTSLAANTAIIGATSGATWTVEEVNGTIVGIALGTWSGTTCSIVLANDIAGVGGVVAGAVQSAGSLCARVYDVGRLRTTTTFTIDVTHF